MHKITHHNLLAEINPLGAELSSLQINGQETLWQGDEKFWTGRAPILFPIVGALKRGQTRIDGKPYEMPRHGIARRKTFECMDQTAHSVSMRLKADADSLTTYPWKFELHVHFTLQDQGIKIRYDVLNQDDHDMLFTLGSHPAFALAISDSIKINDYNILFSQKESLQRHLLTGDGLLENEPVAYPMLKNTITLSDDIFNDDALVFRDIKSDQIHLRCKQQTLLTVDTDGAPHLGIWAKPTAPFVCIEPWLGTSDFVNSNGDFNYKSDLQTLAPQQQYSHQIGIKFP